MRERGEQGERPEVPVAIALGSNLGDRAARIAEAVRRLDEVGVVVERASSLYEAAPIGFGDDRGRVPWFLNAVCVGRTVRTPEDLLRGLKELERSLGREPAPGLGPRPIDLDLVLYGQRVVRSRGLTLPHPRFRERAFVLVPLSEIAPDWVDPVTGRTVRELADLLEGSQDGIRRHGPPPPTPPGPRS